MSIDSAIIAALEPSNIINQFDTRLKQSYLSEMKQRMIDRLIRDSRELHMKGLIDDSQFKKDKLIRKCVIKTKDILEQYGFVSMSYMIYNEGTEKRCYASIDNRGRSDYPADMIIDVFGMLIDTFARLGYEIIKDEGTSWTIRVQNYDFIVDKYKRDVETVIVERLLDSGDEETA